MSLVDRREDTHHFASAFREMRQLEDLYIPNLASGEIDFIPPSDCEFRLRYLQLARINPSDGAGQKLSDFLEQQTEIGEILFEAQPGTALHDIIANLPGHCLPKLKTVQMFVGSAYPFFAKRVTSISLNIELGYHLTEPLPHLQSLQTNIYCLERFKELCPNLLRLHVSTVRLVLTFGIRMHNFDMYPDTESC